MTNATTQDAGTFREEDHPRADNGQFGTGSGAPGAGKAGAERKEDSAASAKPVAHLSGNEVSTKKYPTLTLENTSSAVFEWVNENWRKDEKGEVKISIFPMNGGGDAQFTRRSAKKLKDSVNKILDLARAVPAIPAILKSGAGTGFHPSNKDRSDDFTEFQEFDAPVQIENTVHQIRVVVGKGINGSRVYHLTYSPGTQKTKGTGVADELTPVPVPSATDSADRAASVSDDPDDVKIVITGALPPEWECGNSAAQDAAGPRAAGILYIAGGRVLLIRRSDDAADYPGTWAFPAGGIEQGETPLQAALRESSEEVGHAPDTAQPLQEREGFALFISRGPAFAPILNGESTGYDWASPGSLPAPLHPGVQEAVALALMASATDATFREEDHPRADNGQFGTGSGASGSGQSGGKRKEDHAASAKPVAQLSGAEVSTEKYPVLTPENLRNAVTEWVNEKWRPIEKGERTVSFFPMNGGGDARFSGSSANKLRDSVHKSIELARMVPAIPAILKNGHRLDNVDLYKDRKDHTTEYSYFDAPVQLEGVIHQARVMVGKDKDGHRVYHLMYGPDAKKTKDPRVTGGLTLELGSSATDSADRESSVSDDPDDVKIVITGAQPPEWACGDCAQDAVVHDVPYLRVQGGADAVIIDPQPGDIGIAVFADRDISAVKASGGQRAPGSGRVFDLADALYLGGVLNGQPRQFVRFSGEDIEIVSPTKIRLSAPNIEMQASSAITLQSGALTHNGTNVGSSHVHGGISPGGADTAGPH